MKREGRKGLPERRITQPARSIWPSAIVRMDEGFRRPKTRASPRHTTTREVDVRKADLRVEEILNSMKSQN